MILCGIDSSTNYTALSYFQDGEFKKYELIDLHKERDAQARLKQMILKIYDVLNEWNPDVIYQECTWVSRNPKTVLTLTSLIGAVQGWAFSHDCEWNKIFPSEWRASLGLNEHGKDRFDLKMFAKEYIKTEYGIEVPTDDVSDAICIGLAGVKIINTKGEKDK